MLENLRDKIINVQHDLSASFRNLTTGDGQLYRRQKHGNYKGISQNAGADLLHHYQKQWEEMHNFDAENAKRAEEVDALIGNLHKQCEQELAAIRQLNSQLKALPALQSSIMMLMGKIGELEGIFEEVEDALINLEDTIETQELQERQLDHRFQLALYKEKKLADFEALRAKLAEEHAHNIAEFERRQKEILKERERTFKEAFEEDLQQYRQHGRVERVSSCSSADSQVLLENIELNQDSAELNDFLGDETGEETPAETKTEESSEVSEEEKQ